VIHLRQIMLEELERRNYAPGTIRSYIRTVEHFAQYFHCSPDKLGLDHIRRYQAEMFRTWKLAPNTIAQRLAALRFLYIQVLKRGWSAAETPYPKKVLHLPEILSQQEVAQLIDAAETPFQRTAHRSPTTGSPSTTRIQDRRMNRQLEPRTDAMLPHPHSLCALRHPHTLDPRLSSRSSDLTTPNSGQQLPGLERLDAEIHAALVAHTN
jgi:Phage integrase, N-terminal SAM-like domain